MWDKNDMQLTLRRSLAHKNGKWTTVQFKESDNSKLDFNIL